MLGAEGRAFLAGHGKRLKVECFYETDGLKVEGAVCDGCGACIDTCPMEAISWVDGGSR